MCHSLTLSDYVYGATPTTNRFNFIGDDISSLFSPSASVPKLTGFHNFDNNISTVFGSYKNDQTNSGDPINPVIFWENNSSGTSSRLRFLNKTYKGGGFKLQRNGALY